MLRFFFGYTFRNSGCQWGSVGGQNYIMSFLQCYTLTHVCIHMYLYKTILKTTNLGKIQKYVGSLSHIYYFLIYN